MHSEKLARTIQQNNGKCLRKIRSISLNILLRFDEVRIELPMRASQKPHSLENTRINDGLKWEKQSEHCRTFKNKVTQLTETPKQSQTKESMRKEHNIHCY